MQKYVVARNSTQLRYRRELFSCHVPKWVKFDIFGSLGRQWYRLSHHIEKHLFIVKSEHVWYSNIDSIGWVHLLSSAPLPSFILHRYCLLLYCLDRVLPFMWRTSVGGLLALSLTQPRCETVYYRNHTAPLSLLR